MGASVPQSMFQNVTIATATGCHPAQGWLRREQGCMAARWAWGCGEQELGAPRYSQVLWGAQPYHIRQRCCARAGARAGGSGEGHARAPGAPGARCGRAHPPRPGWLRGARPPHPRATAGGPPTCVVIVYKRIFRTTGKSVLCCFSTVTQLQNRARGHAWPSRRCPRCAEVEDCGKPPCMGVQWQHRVACYM